MQNRLKHLESLVKGAMASQPPDEHQPIHAGATSHPPLPDNYAGMDISGRLVGLNDTTYIGGSHWAAILEDIEEMKGYFSEDIEETSLGVGSTRPDISLLLNNTESPTTYKDLLAALPGRSMVNRLVSRYFNSNSPALHIIHKPTFQKHYRKFWDDPHGSPISFLALIYAVMCLGAFVALGADEEHPNSSGTSPEMVQIYRGCCAQCLALSNYAKHSGPYTLETFLLYIEADFVLSKGNQMSCYLIVGVAVRLAFRMGLHRDPNNMTEITGMSYTLAKGRLARVFQKIVEQANLLTLPNYAEVTALDRELQQAFSAIPPFLCVVPIDLCITDSAELIIRRLSLAVLFHKSRCILHRKYITKVGENAEFLYSKKAAIDASRELLRIQSEVHDATQPGAVLCKDLWVISSLAMHDLLLAAVIPYLCLIQESMIYSSRGQQIPDPHQADMISDLETSCRIWYETRSMSVDTSKAHAVLSNMMKRLNSIYQRHSVESSVYIEAGDAREVLSGSLLELSAGAFSNYSGGQHEGFDDAIPFSSHTSQSNIDFGTIPINFIGESSDTPMNFDWDVFDNGIRQTHANDRSWPNLSIRNSNSGEENDYICELESSTVSS
ncbi:hypothetical protein EYB25_007343 [Talaromyces marneffei]|nr:hypothetical protein EYB25_007343 [Talaromyces marneffei]